MSRNVVMGVVVATMVITLGGGGFMALKRHFAANKYVMDNEKINQEAIKNMNPHASAATVVSSSLSSHLQIQADELYLGNPDAPVTIIEYASLTCGHCANFAKYVMPKITTDYIDTGKVKMVVRMYPLDAMATAASSVLMGCFKEKDGYYDFMHKLFLSQAVWVLPNSYMKKLEDMASTSGVDSGEFAQCSNQEAVKQKIRDIQDVAYKNLAVNSTPTFFIDGKMYRGAMDFKDLKRIIDAWFENNANTTTLANE